jgi:uncharacterized protein YndB with AHSA1/START domain
MTDQTLNTVQVTHRFSASAERVFDAWLEPKTAGKFLFATPTGQMVRVEIDARIGGAFCFTDRRDGEDIDHVGRYEAIERPKRLAFTFTVPKFTTEETRVVIDITPLASGCELILTHEGVLPDFAERTVGGWTMILGRLAEVL